MAGRLSNVLPSSSVVPAVGWRVVVAVVVVEIVVQGRILPPAPVPAPPTAVVAVPTTIIINCVPFLSAFDKYRAMAIVYFIVFLSVYDTP